MKWNKEKISAFFKAKGFYIVAVLCLAAVGVAAYSAYSGASSNIKINENTVSSEQSIVSSEPETTEEPSEETEEAQTIVEGIEDETESVTQNAKQTQAQTPKFVLPVHGDIIKKSNTEELSFSATYGDFRLHTGTDISCDEGTEVNSAFSGIVESVEQDTVWGTVITINHQNGITAKYMNVTPNDNIKEGVSVTAETVLGKTASIPAESADEPHLHIEVFKDGKPISPLSLMGLE